MPSTSYHGLLVIDKPSGMTSRAAVDRLQRLFPRGTKIGHTGTLDPLATGVLVVCFGAATRLTEYLQSMTKTYRAGVRLGCRSDTDDADGVVTEVDGATAPDRAAVEQCLSGFIGFIEQTPPKYSAAKLEGRRAYDLARRGQEVALRPRRVHIGRIDLVSYEYPQLEIEVRCGKGTYIRSLARDIGELLHCGGLIQTLRRTKVGWFREEDALSLDADAESIRAQLLPLSAAVPYLVQVQLDDTRLRNLRRGLAVPAEVVVSPEDDDVAILDSQGELVALGRFDRASGLLHPKKVIVF
jgi:tRNA pseudouridine55 synthase